MTQNSNVTLRDQEGGVDIEGLTRAFHGHRILDGLSLHIQAGEFVALLGKSGSGKSTLLRALAGLDDDVAGEGTLFVPTARSVMFQDSRLLPWETVMANVMLGIERHGAQADALEALQSVGLGGRLDAWPIQLSGGEQQRVALARSLVRKPRLLLADEPFGALDALTRLKMHQLLRVLILRHRPTVVLVTHDVDEALALADRILVLDNGKIGDDFPVEIPHPRRSSHSGFEPLRQRLLRNLGVTETV